VLWLVWIALGVGLAAVAGALAFAVVRGLRLWRQLRATGAALAQELERLAAAGEQIAARAERLGGDTPRLAARLERLSESRARLAILLSAVQGVRASVGRLTTLAPRK
jgi:hypothetical protein